MALSDWNRGKGGEEHRDSMRRYSAGSTSSVRELDTPEMETVNPLQEIFDFQDSSRSSREVDYRRHVLDDEPLGAGILQFKSRESEILELAEAEMQEFGSRDSEEISFPSTKKQRGLHQVEQVRQLKSIGILHSTRKPLQLLELGKVGTSLRSCGTLATRRQFRIAAVGFGLCRETAILDPKQIRNAEDKQSPSLHLCNVCRSKNNRFSTASITKWVYILAFFIFEGCFSIMIFYTKDGMNSTVLQLPCRDEVPSEECMGYRCTGMCEFDSIRRVCRKTCLTCNSSCITLDTFNLDGEICTNVSACGFETVHSCDTWSKGEISAMWVPEQLSDSEETNNYRDANGKYIYESCSQCGECIPEESDAMITGDYPYEILTLVCLCEAAKFVFFGLILVSKGLCLRPSSSRTVFAFAGMAPFDVFCFYLKILALKYLNPSQFTVLINMDIIFSCLVGKLILKFKIARVQYLGLSLILAGCIQLCVHWKKTKNTDDGIGILLLASAISAVWNILSEKGLGIEDRFGAFHRTFMMALWSTLFSGFLLIVTTDTFSSNFFKGWSSRSWTVCIILVGYEIILLLVRDMLNLFTASIIVAFSIPLTLLMDQVLFLEDSGPGAIGFFSALIVMFGVLLFNTNHVGFHQYLNLRDIDQLQFRTSTRKKKKVKHSRSKKKKKRRLKRAKSHPVISAGVSTRPKVRVHHQSARRAGTRRHRRTLSGSRSSIRK